MTDLERTTCRTVEFAYPFILDKSDGEMSPGRYEVETEEELIPGLSFLAYWRVRTTMITPATAHGSLVQRQILTIDPQLLEAALALDQQRSELGAEVSSPLAGSQGASPDAPAARAIRDPARAPRPADQPSGAGLQTNALIASAPVLIPILIVACLTLITWYRPGEQVAPLGARPAEQGTAMPAR